MAIKIEQLPCFALRAMQDTVAVLRLRSSQTLVAPYAMRGCLWQNNTPLTASCVAWKAKHGRGRTKRSHPWKHSKNH